jgi:hypothetical protein
LERRDSVRLFELRAWMFEERTIGLGYVGILKKK